MKFYYQESYIAQSYGFSLNLLKLELCEIEKQLLFKNLRAINQNEVIKLKWHKVGLVDEIC